MRALIGIFGVALVGCSTIQTNEYDAQVQQKAIETQERLLSQPTLSIICQQGCTATYSDPKGRQVDMPTNAYDLGVEQAKQTGRVFNVLIPAAAGVYLGGKIVDALESTSTWVNEGEIIGGDRNTDSYNNSSTNDSGNTTVSDSGNDQSVNDSGNDQSVNDSGNDQSVNDSGNDNSTVGETPDGTEN